jgi:hypothetical protein
MVGIEDKHVEVGHARRDARPFVHADLHQHGRVRLLRRGAAEDPDGKIERF